MSGGSGPKAPFERRKEMKARLFPRLEVRRDHLDTYLVSGCLGEKRKRGESWYLRYLVPEEAESPLLQRPVTSLPHESIRRKPGQSCSPYGSYLCHFVHSAFHFLSPSGYSDSASDGGVKQCGYIGAPRGRHRCIFFLPGPRTDDPATLEAPPGMACGSCIP